MAKARSGVWPWVGIIVATLVFIVVARWWRGRPNATPDVPGATESSGPVPHPGGATRAQAGVTKRSNEGSRPTQAPPAPGLPVAPAPSAAPAGALRHARYAICEAGDEEVALTLVRVPERATPLLVVACGDRYEVLDLDSPRRDGALVVDHVATFTWTQARAETVTHARAAVVPARADDRAHIVLAFARNTPRGGTRGGQVIEVSVDGLGVWGRPRLLHQMHAAGLVAGAFGARGGDAIVAVDSGEPWIARDFVATLGAAGAHAVGASGLQPHGIRHGDVDGDGHLDIVVFALGFGMLPAGSEPAYVEVPELRVLRGDGEGGFAAPESCRVALGRAGIVADLDGDQRADVLVQHGWHTSIVRRADDGSCAATPASELEECALAMTDLDGDGTDDAVALCQSVGRIRSVAGRVQVTPWVSLGARANDVASADFDDDGELDLAGVIVDLTTARTRPVLVLAPHTRTPVAVARPDAPPLELPPAHHVFAVP